MHADGEAFDLCGLRSTARTSSAASCSRIAADRDDSGVASAVIGGASLGQSGATMIDCGLPAGYFADRFGALHALGLEAARLGRPVQWA